MMTHTTFYRGLLYALREKGPDSFIADGDLFHKAFHAVLYEAAKKHFGPAQEMLENYDPVFGVYPEANEMLLEAERDFILSMMNPHLRRAQFKISKGIAHEELESLADKDTFRELATRFLNESVGG
jgi:hypothetical protein